MIENEVLNAARARLLRLSADVNYLDRDEGSDAPVDGDGRTLPFFYVYNLVAPPTPFALRRGGSCTASGVLQVSLNVDSYTGRDDAVILARKIVALFPRLISLGRGRVEPLAYAASPLEEAPYIQVPITIPWRARVTEADL